MDGVRFNLFFDFSDLYAKLKISGKKINILNCKEGFVEAHETPQPKS